MTTATPAASGLRDQIVLAQERDADALLTRDPLALLVGMLLDQQFPMERAFAGPWTIAQRLGVETLDAAAIAAMDPDAFTTLCCTPPAIHRYPASMATRIIGVCTYVASELDNDVTRVWTSASTGAQALKHLKALPGFGDQKARIFLALLGKQRGLDLPGWQAAAGAYGDAGSRRSVADVTSAETLAEVRAFKQETKKAAKAAAASSEPSEEKK